MVGGERALMGMTVGGGGMLGGGRGGVEGGRGRGVRGNPENFFFLSRRSCAALQDHGVLPPCSLSLCLFLSPAQQPVAFHGSKSGCAVTWGRLAKLRPQ